MAMANIVVNNRIRSRISVPGVGSEQIIKVFSKEMESPESEESAPVPAVAFRETEMKNSLAMCIVSTFKGLGLAMKSPTLNCEAIMEFARERLRYFDDDIPHEDFFD